MKYIKQLIYILVVSVLAACGGKDDASSSSAGFNKSAGDGYAGARTPLLDSLAALYPNGKLPADRAAESDKDLAENPAVLLLTSEAPKQVRSQSTGTVVQPMALSADFKPVIRIQNTSLFGVYFFTIYDDERAAALVANPNWKQEGPAFWASLANGDGLNPVHRFRNLKNGSYLYTIYDTERTDIVTHFASTFVYEGVAWFARQTQSDGWTPLYRFRNMTNGTYLFSAYESEKDAIVANYPTVFKLEGVAYYVRQGAPVDPPLPQAAVSNISPTDATLGVPTIFTVSGNNLPLTAVLSVLDASCAAATGNTVTGFSQSCTLGGAVGAKTATIVSANGGTVIDASRSISAVAATVLPTVTNMSPTTATIGVATVFTVTGTNLPLTSILAIQSANCLAPAGNTSSGFNQVCTFNGSVGLQAVTISSAAGGAVIDGSRSVSAVAPTPTATVASISPTSATLGVPTIFTVSGSNLPLTAILTVQGASCLTPTGNTVTGFSQSCTLGGAVGAKTATIVSANGGTVIDASRSISAVAATVLPTVTNMSPTTATIGVATVFTVTGTNLPLTSILAIQSANCLAPAGNTSSGFNQVCTFNGSVGLQAVTISSAAGGAVIDGSRSVSAVAPTPTATVASISPTLATINVATVFAVAGSNLPLTATMTLLDAICQAPVGNTSNGFSQTCIPGGAAGAKLVTVKTASAGIVIDASRTVNVVSLPVVTTVSPGAATLGVATVFTVTGTGLPLTSILAVQDATCLSPLGNTATGFNQTCTLGGALGTKTITVKTAPAASGGTVIDATRSVLVVAVVIGALNDTGITTSQCYAAGSDVLVSCASVGASALSATQDGLVGRDRTAPSSTDGRLGFSYSSSTQPVTNCVTDRVTGLVWEVKTADGGLRDKNKTYTNYADSTQSATYGTATDAKGYVDAVKSLALCGFTDWRLPTKQELQGLVDYSISEPGPTIDPTWFPNTAANVLDWRYWTSSGYVLDALQAWKVGFSIGDSISGERAYDGYVRLVRGSQPVLAQRYLYSADGLEVNDILTGLTWRRCPEGYNLTNIDPTCASNNGLLFTHANALVRAATRSTQTGKAWRVPNAKELMSIIDVTKNGPPFNTAIFPNNNSDTNNSYLYWTGTPFVSKSKGAWAITLKDGTLTPNIRAQSNGYAPSLLRLVRDTQ